MWNNKKRRTKWKVGIILLFCFVLLLPLFAGVTTVSAEERKTIRVAFPVQEGMSYFHADGTPDGYNYTYLEKIAEYTGWKMEYVPYDSGDVNENVANALSDLQDGKVDLLGPLLRTEGTEQLFSFPTQNYGTVYTTLCALESGNLREENASLKNPLKVGLWEQAQTRNQEVISYLDSENYNYELYYYETSEEQQQALKDGTVDVISNLSLNPIAGTRLIEKFAPRPYYFASAKGNTELIQELDEAISTVNQVQTSLQDVLFEKYFRNTRYLFTPDKQQKDYLSSVGEIKVLCMESDAPYVYQIDGKPEGMLVSIVYDFANETGISVQYTFCADRAEAEKMLKTEKYDLLLGMATSSNYCANIGFVRSKSIMESGLAYLHFSEKSSYKTVAMKKGMAEQIDTSSYEKVTEYDTISECINAVRKGTVDCALGDRSELEYYLYDTYAPLTISQISGEEQSVCIGINRENDLQFIRIMNDYIYSLSDSQITTFLEEGNIHPHQVSLKSYVRFHPIQAVVIGIILAAVIAIAGSMLYHAKKMQKKNNELQAANMAKSEFLTRMSHDIRTPMNGIIGLLDISDKFLDQPETVGKYHEKIRTASEYLLSLINDALDMSKLDSQDIHLTQDSVYLHELMDSCKEILEPKAVERGIEMLTPEFDEFHPPRVFTSELHLRQVIMNIVSNAIKYNRPNGQVVLFAEILEQTEDTVTCRFAVEDTGIGMSEKFQKQMFEPFSQEHGENRSEFKGTGLGLSIVKGIIDKMHGEIHVESSPGMGTKFVWILTFQLDKEYRQEEEKNVARAACDIDLHGINVLAAEDNALNAEILAFLLEDLGAKVFLVENGELAVETFAKSEPGYYDLILMDIMMPVMDGYTASKRIRRMNRPDATQIPIIALTANAFAEDVAKSVEAGMNAHISKPIDANKLKACIGKYVIAQENSVI